MHLKCILFMLIVTSGKTLANQLRCYACSFSSTDSDRSCLEITEATNTVSCPYTYCTIFRQEYLDPSGVVVSFVRGCELQPDYLNHEVVDSTFRTFYRACTSDLCNEGNGIESVVGGNLSPTPIYNGLNLLVPGTGSYASRSTKISILLLISCILTIVF